jgi:hypothetical protein
MATKKSKKTTPKAKPAPNKSAFIRANASLPVAEIIAKAAKSGVGKLTPGFCYTILSELRKKTKGAPSKAHRPTVPAPARTGSSKSDVATFAALIIKLGTERAQALFQSTLDKVQKSVG